MEHGYGVCTENAKWGLDAYEKLYDIAKKDSILHEKITEYYEEHKEEYPSEAAAFSDFVDQEYENEAFLWRGFEGFLTDLINALEFGGETVFRFEDECMYVAAYIPVDSNSRVITQNDIEALIRKYVGPLLKENLNVGWYRIAV